MFYGNTLGNFGIPSRWNLFPQVPLRGKCTLRHILLYGYVGQKERMLVVEDGIFDGIYIRRKLELFRWNIEKFHAQEICKRCMLGTYIPRVGENSARNFGLLEEEKFWNSNKF